MELDGGPAHEGALLAAGGGGVVHLVAEDSEGVGPVPIAGKAGVEEDELVGGVEVRYGNLVDLRKVVEVSEGDLDLGGVEPRCGVVLLADAVGVGVPGEVELGVAATLAGERLEEVLPVGGRGEYDLGALPHLRLGVRVHADIGDGLGALVEGDGIPSGR